jgi:ACDE family multidrug resistance protein
MRDSRNIALWVILASGTLTVMGGAIIAPVLNVMRQGLGVDPALAGLIITTHSVFIAVLSPLVGVVIDRVGVKKPFVAGLALYGLAGGSGLFIQSYWLLIASRALLGVGAAVIFISNTVMILNIFRGPRRNKVMGWRGSANAFGGVIWPLIGGFLGGWSWHLPFAAYLAGVPLAALALLVIPEVHETTRQVQDGSESIWRIFRTTPVLFFIYLLIFISSVLLYTIVVFIPPLLEEIGIHRTLYIGLFISAMGLASGLTSFMYGRIKSRLSYGMIVLISVAFWAVGFISISQTHSIALIIISIALFGIGQGMVSPSCMVWIGEAAPLSFRGRVSSYVGTFAFIGQFLSPVIFAPVVLIMGPGGVFLTAGMACGVLLVILALVRK